MSAKWNEISESAIRFRSNNEAINVWQSQPQPPRLNHSRAIPATHPNVVSTNRSHASAGKFSCSDNWKAAASWLGQECTAIAIAIPIPIPGDGNRSAARNHAKSFLTICNSSVSLSNSDSHTSCGGNLPHMQTFLESREPGATPTGNKSCNEYIWQREAMNPRKPKKCCTLLGVGGVKRFTLA